MLQKKMTLIFYYNKYFYKKLYMMKTNNEISIVMKIDKNTKYKKVYNYKKDKWYI